MVNKVILIGNLGKDPELRFTESGKAVCTFSIATSEKWTGDNGQKQDKTTWHNIVAWGKTGEIIKEYLTKGSQIYIEGKIDNRTYDDKDGNKRCVSEIIVKEFKFLGGGSKATADKEPDQQPPVGGDDDLPF